MGLLFDKWHRYTMEIFIAVEISVAILTVTDKTICFEQNGSEIFLTTNIFLNEYVLLRKVIQIFETFKGGYTCLEYNSLFIPILFCLQRKGISTSNFYHYIYRRFTYIIKFLSVKKLNNMSCAMKSIWKCVS